MLRDCFCIKTTPKIQSNQSIWRYLNFIILYSTSESTNQALDLIVYDGAAHFSRLNDAADFCSCYSSVNWIIVRQLTYVTG